MRILLTGVFALCLTVLAGCGEHREKENPSAPHFHVDVAPHGGTPVGVGDDYQIEWVLDAPTGKLQAYILDGEMENFIRITPPSFDLNVKLSNRQEVLHFVAVANNATGEKVGSTSLFEAQADWLKTNNSFDAVLPALNIEGKDFTNITFSFPKDVQEK